MMNWELLLSDLRAGRNGADPASSFRSEFRSPYEADYDRVLYSAAFRRLARKTQVHPNAENDHVHNRLTHSLEVASASRSLARHLGFLLVDKGLMPESNTAEDLIWINQSACLGHDIGNPPFGHAGEYAIREWFENNEESVLNGHKDVSESVLNEWKKFEGNAQSFRICSQTDIQNTTGYIRMTYASLGAMVKYPWGSADPKASGGKYNYFDSEKELFDDVWNRLGLVRDGKYVRHPMSYLTEASDDICYRVLDVEDAVVMKIIERDQAKELFRAVIGDDELRMDIKLEELRARAIGRLIDAHWQVFEKLFDSINFGHGPKSLSDELEPGLACSVQNIRDISSKIYGVRSKVATELGAYKSLGKIVKAICHAVLELSDRGSFKLVSFSKQRCLELCWGQQFCKDNEKRNMDWWMIRSRDYITGLTDNFATQLASEIEGI